MKRTITLIIGALLLALVAGATDVPKVETFLGYTYVRTDLGSNTGLAQSIGSFSMDGGSAQFIYNFNKWFGGVADLGAVNKGNVAVLNVDDRRAFFMAGPRGYHIERRRAGLPISRSCSAHRTGRSAMN